MSPWKASHEFGELSSAGTQARRQSYRELPYLLFENNIICFLFFNLKNFSVHSVVNKESKKKEMPELPA